MEGCGRDGVDGIGETDLDAGGVGIAGLGSTGLVTGNLVELEVRVLGEMLDAMLDDLDKRTEEMSDVETRDMGGLVLEDRESYRSVSRRRCAVRMVSCIAAMVSCSVSTSECTGRGTREETLVDVGRLDMVIGAMTGARGGEESAAG